MSAYISRLITPVSDPPELIKNYRLFDEWCFRHTRMSTLHVDMSNVRAPDAKYRYRKMVAIEIDEYLSLHDFSEFKCALLINETMYLVYKDLNRRSYQISKGQWIEEERLMTLFKQHGLPVMKSKEEYMTTFGTTTDV